MFSARKGDFVYDTLMKQLFERFGKELLHLLLNVDPVEIQEVPRELFQLKQTKTYREHADFLAWMQLKKQKQNDSERSRDEKERKLFHIEFQIGNDPQIHFRLVTYLFLIKGKYGLFPEQVLIYLGQEKLGMEEIIEFKGMFSGFYHKVLIINLREIDPEIFLNAEEPLIAILSIISDRKSLDEVFPRLKERLVEAPAKDRGLIVTAVNYLLLLRVSHEKAYELLTEVIDLLGIKKEELILYKEGRKEGLVDSILILMENKFGLKGAERKKVEKKLLKINDENYLEGLIPKILEAEKIDIIMKELDKKLKK